MASGKLFANILTMQMASGRRYISQTAQLCKIQNVVVIGAGLMGSGIAQVRRYIKAFTTLFYNLFKYTVFC